MSLLAHQELFERVATRLRTVPTKTDHQLLMCWKVVKLCHQLIGQSNNLNKQKAIEALEVFSLNGVCEATGKLFVGLEKNKNQESSIRPTLSHALGEKVLEQLERYEAFGEPSLELALNAEAKIKESLKQEPKSMVMAGLSHRLALAYQIARNTQRPLNQRIRASAAIIYLEEVFDAIPDSLGLIGLIDDDFALQTVLKELLPEKAPHHHWSETISEVWDDLPFLRGLQLQRAETPVPTTWLDRVNGYLCHKHFNQRNKTLVLIQPSIECSLLQPLLTLTGWLILDALTSAKNLVASLVVGQTYEINGEFIARYHGKDDRGWPRLEFSPQGRGPKIRSSPVKKTCPPDIANRMVPIQSNHLSSFKDFIEKTSNGNHDPIQKFFGWNAAIGSANIPAKIVLVTSKRRAQDLFQGIESNGISLLGSGLAKSCTRNTDPATVAGGLILIVPDLATARHFENIAVIVIDGYEKVRHGQSDLDEIMRPRLGGSPAVILWTHQGYFPFDQNDGLRQAQYLFLPKQDLSQILELDDDFDAEMTLHREALWEAAIGMNLELIQSPYSDQENILLASISSYSKELKRYKLSLYDACVLDFPAKRLRTFVTDIPILWPEVQAFAQQWNEKFLDRLNDFSSSQVEELESLKHAHLRILHDLDQIKQPWNTRVAALGAFLDRQTKGPWTLVCDRPDQLAQVQSYLEVKSDARIVPSLIAHLPSCRHCLVMGPPRKRLRRIQAHTPLDWCILVDEGGYRRWKNFEKKGGDRAPESMLSVFGVTTPEHEPKWAEVPVQPTPFPVKDLILNQGERYVACVIIWLAGEPYGRVLAPQSRVLVDVDGKVREKRAKSLEPNEVVILNTCFGASPADAFTQEIALCIEKSRPDLVSSARSWRRALRQWAEGNQLTLKNLQLRLDQIGVKRDRITLRSWLETEQAAPIRPHHARDVLDALWQLIGPFPGQTVTSVLTACKSLTDLKRETGRALLDEWQGKYFVPGPFPLPDQLLGHLMRKTLVQEIVAITHVKVPSEMLGWWVSPEQLRTYKP